VTIHIDKNMYEFIYITTNAINDKKYVGMCSSVKRFKGYLGSGILLKQAIAKYGRGKLKMFKEKKEGSV
jgi:hypothetical protein